MTQDRRFFENLPQYLHKFYDVTLYPQYTIAALQHAANYQKAITQTQHKVFWVSLPSCQTSFADKSLML